MNFNSFYQPRKGVLLMVFLCFTLWLNAQVKPALSLSQLLKQNSEWYATAEAIRIADNMVLYQHNNGGWDKNIDMTKPLGADEKVLVTKRKAEAGTTIDNGATYSQMFFMQKMYSATHTENYRTAFLKGLDFLLEAQYDSGGWPQFYPIKKGYYEHITFNDGAMIGAMRVLREVALNKPGFEFVDETRRRKALTAVNKGLEVILKTQVEANGVLTAWCAQHDRFTFKPQKARAYELPSISGNESVGIVRYLMEIDSPSPEIIHTIQAAVTWFDKVKIEGKKLIRKEDPSLSKGFDLIMVEDATASPIWARFYSIDTDKPMYVGRDGLVKDDIAKIEYERRVGYGYLTDLPQNLIERDYPKWKAKWVKNN